MTHAGLYVHIPFCRKKCSYCDFLSFANLDTDLIDRYIEALAPSPTLRLSLDKTSTSTSASLGAVSLSNRSVESLGIAQGPPSPPAKSGGRGSLLDNLWISTIYIGGGTPTLLSETQLEKLIGSIFKNFQISDFKNGKNDSLSLLRNSPLDSLRSLGAQTVLAAESECFCHSSSNSDSQEIFNNIEFSVEANPGTIDLNKLKLLKSLGVNRLSIGAQTFNDNELEILGRIHSSHKIYKSFEAAQKVGFSNINLDLIFAIPGQSLESWLNTLKEAVKLNPTHISAYNLQLEEKTFFHKNKDAYNFLDDEAELEMYKLTIEFLKAHGYEHYEISNFAKPGFECRHNINYWKNGDYIGLGLGASTHLHGRRWQNTSNLDEYLKELRAESREVRRNNNSFHLSSQLSALTSASSTELSETIFMGLRMIKGINLKEFSDRFGISLLDKYSEEIEQLLNDGLIEQDNISVRLSGKGLFLANEVFERFV